MRYVLPALLLLVCAGCPKPPPKLPKPAPEAALPAPNPEWDRDLPPTIRGVRLHAADDCVFVTGVDTGEGQDRVQVCIDSRTGEVKWVHKDPVASAVHAVDTYFILNECLLHAWREALVCVNRKDGTELWKFAGGEGESLYATHVADQTVVVSVGNHRMVVLDGATGKVQQDVPLEDDPIKAVAQTSRGPVAVIVDVRPGDSGEAMLAGIELETGERIWSLPVSSWSYDVEVVDDTLVGWLREGQFWGVSAVDGTVTWRISEEDLPGTPQFGTRHLLVSKAGEALTIVAIRPAALPSSDAEWSLTIPSQRALLGVEELPGDARALGATLDTFFQFDVNTGRLGWTYSFNRAAEPGPWANASSNGDALFLYFARDGKPGLLKRIPVLAE